MHFRSTSKEKKGLLILLEKKNQNIVGTCKYRMRPRALHHSGHKPFHADFAWRERKTGFLL